MKRFLLLFTLVAFGAYLSVTLTHPGGKAQARSSGDGLPDLIVSNIQTEWEGGNGCLVSFNQGIRVWVQNIGNADAGPFVVDINGAQWNVDGLAAGATISQWFGGIPGFVHVVADSTNMVTESNENNNTRDAFLVTATPPPTCTPTVTPGVTPTPTSTPTWAPTPRVLDYPTPGITMYARFGCAVAAGDVNGDGATEIVVGANDDGDFQKGAVYVFSAATGNLLYTLYAPNSAPRSGFGCSLALGDINGDGKAEIVVGAEYQSNLGANLGQVYVFSGTDGSLLFTLITSTTPSGWAQTAEFGASVAVGDVNGDGRADIAVGAPEETVSGQTYSGRVYVFSGVDHSLLMTLTDPLAPRPGSYFYFGDAVAAGDVNGDGHADIAVYAGDQIDASHSPHVYVFSGANGQLLYSLTAGLPIAVGDVNQDGKADIAAGNGPGGISLFSGSNGLLLYTLVSTDPANLTFGNQIAIGDGNNDGKNEVVVEANMRTPDNRDGRVIVYLFSGLDGSPSSYIMGPDEESGTGCSVAVGNSEGETVTYVAASACYYGYYQGQVYLFSLGSSASPTPSPSPSPSPTISLANPVGGVAELPSSDGVHRASETTGRDAVLVILVAAALTVVGATIYGTRRYSVRRR